MKEKLGRKKEESVMREEYPDCDTQAKSARLGGTDRFYPV